MNDLETTFSITGGAVAVFAGLATIYYFKRTDEYVPYYEKSISEHSKKPEAMLKDSKKFLDSWLDDYYPVVAKGKHKHSKKYKRR